MLMKQKMNIVGPGGCLPNVSYSVSPGGSFGRGRENTKDKRLNFGRKPMKTSVRMRNKLIIGFMIMLMAVVLIPAMAFAVSDEEAVEYLRNHPAALVTVNKVGTTTNRLLAAASASSTSNLVARYDATNNTGSSHSNTATTIADLSGKGHTGTVYNITWGEDYAEFNGTNSWVNLGVMNSNDITLEVTFNASSTVYHHLIGNWESGGGGLWLNEGKLGGNWYINGKYEYLYSSTTVETGKKYHAALTYDGSILKLYLNGKLESSRTVSGTVSAPVSSTVMALGVNPAGAAATNDGLFKGKIYTAAIYDGALSAEQIAKDASLSPLMLMVEQYLRLQRV